mmetsp:Transcript_2110/g.5159  ORF Transcript_2110/g.5159 Transcript_2110/m.5159 type:complete len:248 (+) Transcript_2110:880-1623(+)
MRTSHSFSRLSSRPHDARANGSSLWEATAAVRQVCCAWKRVAPAIQSFASLTALGVITRTLPISSPITQSPEGMTPSETGGAGRGAETAAHAGSTGAPHSSSPCSSSWSLSCSSSSSSSSRSSELLLLYRFPRWLPMISSADSRISDHGKTTSLPPTWYGVSATAELACCATAAAATSMDPPATFVSAIRRSPPSMGVMANSGDCALAPPPLPLPLVPPAAARLCESCTNVAIGRSVGRCANTAAAA